MVLKAALGQKKADLCCFGWFACPALWFKEASRNKLLLVFQIKLFDAVVEKVFK